jgi:succinyl-diaminopimelate desuccinylase
MNQSILSIGEEILALVRVPSVTGTEGTLAGILELRLRAGPAGLAHQVLRVDDTLLLVPHTLPFPVTPPAGGRPIVVLAGHIDTVPRGDSPEPALRDGRVVGRGACDMKAGVAALLQLAESCDPSAGFAHRVFVFYAGEEGPAAPNGLAAILVAHPWLRRAGLALLLEPTCGDLELGCNGSIHLAVTFHGKACHSARPWTGEHPLRHALPWLEAILARPIREAEIAGVTFRELATPTRLRAGDVRNVVPGSLEVNLNLRYPPDRTPAQAEELARSFFPDGTVFRHFGRRPSVGGPSFFEDALEDGGPGACAGEAAGRSGGGGSQAGRASSHGDDLPIPVVVAPPPGSITVELSDHSPAGRIALDAPLYRHLLESTGLPRSAKQGWTDVARFSALGVPALNWGPGDPAFAHTKDEFVDVAAAERFVARLRAYLLGAGPKA